MLCHSIPFIPSPHRIFTASPLLNAYILEDILVIPTTPVDCSSPAVLALFFLTYLTAGNRQWELWQKGEKPAWGFSWSTECVSGVIVCSIMVVRNSWTAGQELVLGSWNSRRIKTLSASVKGKQNFSHCFQMEQDWNPRSESAWQFAVCLLISRQYRLHWCRGVQEPEQRQGGIISSAY